MLTKLSDHLGKLYTGIAPTVVPNGKVSISTDWRDHHPDLQDTHSGRKARDVWGQAHWLDPVSTKHWKPLLFYSISVQSGLICSMHQLLMGKSRQEKGTHFHPRTWGSIQNKRTRLHFKLQFLECYQLLQWERREPETGRDQFKRLWQSQSLRTILGLIWLILTAPPVHQKNSISGQLAGQNLPTK